MKNLVLGSLSALTLLSTIAPNAIAVTSTVGQALSSTTTSATAILQTRPVTLVRLAQQGYLKQQGIPYGGDLVFAVQTGQVTPEKLVQAAIDARLVSSKTLQNPGYLNIVDLELRDLIIY